MAAQSACVHVICLRLRVLVAIPLDDYVSAPDAHYKHRLRDMGKPSEETISQLTSLAIAKINVYDIAEVVRWSS